MPAPDLIAHVHRQEQMRKFLDGLPGSNENITSELRLLREEIAALREDLRQKPSIILIGDDVIAEFERISRH